MDETLAAVSARVRSGEPLSAAQVPVETVGFDRDALGLVWDGFGRDRVTAHLDCGPRHHQPSGVVHGGVWCAVVESVASVGAVLRVAADGLLSVGVSNTTDFLRSHREGRVAAVGTPVHVGRTQQLWQVTLTRTADDALVARGQVRLHNVDTVQLGG